MVVVRGEPTAEELAALTAVLSAHAAAARAAAEAPAPTAPASGWRDRSRTLRPRLHPGPGTWRRSLR
ncbi:acyl-CoA dehydrogenase [Nocardiopsis sp. NRRL B-16309]|nr:acyl-CoA dehydrogenase [Nocardiopsis sp. NRRL B-16309]